MKQFLSIWQRLRVWGIKGIWNFLLRKYHDFKTYRRLLRNARKYPQIPVRGVTIIANLTNHGSLNKVMRDFAWALRKADIPFQTFDLHPQHNSPSPDTEGILTPPGQFRILKYDNIIEISSTPLPKYLPVKRSRIVFWEFTTGLLEYDPILADSPTIIAMSDFNYAVFKQILPSSANVQKILYPFFFDCEAIANKTLTRQKYGIPDAAFVVFFNFDYGSSFHRKNPEGCIKAFSNAFANIDNSVLVFKTMNAARHHTERNRLLTLAEDLGVSKKVIMIDSYIPQHDVYGLTGACDIYLSLHRGEGFGLGIAEAMSLGKAVVVTGFSSTVEFCNAQNSIPIPYSIEAVPEDMHDHPCYHGVKEWAEPNIEVASAELRRLYCDPVLRERLGNAAKAFISEHFSTENFRKSVEMFLCRA